jgi:hypothetical protein
MGMWEGLYLGMQGIRERRDREMDREEARRIREEDMAFRREQFEAQQRIARQGVIRELYPEIQKRSAAASQLASQASILRGYLGDSPIIDTLRASGNPEAVERVISSLEAGYEAAQEEGRGDEFLQLYKTTLENDYRISEATTGEIDFSLFNNVVSPEDFTSLGLPTTFTIPGAVEGRPVVYQPTATIEDLNAVERRIANAAVERGSQEIERLDRSITRINSMLNTDIDPNTEQELRSDLITLGDRRMMIEGVLDETKGDNPSYAGILSIYGNDMVERVLGSGPRRIDPAQLSPSFTDLTSRQPITIVSPEQAQRFFELGVITETDTILYNGQQYPVRDLLEG